MVCTGLGLGVAGATLWARLQLDIFFQTWRPDRSNIFGPPRLHELDRPVAVPAMELLKQSVPSGY